MPPMTMTTNASMSTGRPCRGATDWRARPCAGKTRERCAEREHDRVEQASDVDAERADTIAALVAPARTSSSRSGYGPRARRAAPRPRVPDPMITSRHTG